MSVKERLIHFLISKKISQSAFEKKVGLSNGYVNNIRRSISEITLNKISAWYPELRKEWLLFGEGEMVNGSVDRLFIFLESQGISNEEFYKKTGIPEGYLEGLELQGAGLGRHSFDIVTSFPINYEWLFNGEGEMLSKPMNVKSTQIEFYNKSPEFFNKVELIYDGIFINMGDGKYIVLAPLIEVNDPSYSRLYDDMRYVYNLPKISLILKEDELPKKRSSKYRAFKNLGNDMNNGLENAVKDKDILISDPCDFTAFSMFEDTDVIFVIVHKEKILVRKIIKNNKEEKTIKLGALNNDKGFYPDLTINQADVRELYMVHKLQREVQTFMNS